jgi:hypothetical protein
MGIAKRLAELTPMIDQHVRLSSAAGMVRRCHA